MGAAAAANFDHGRPVTGSRGQSGRARAQHGGWRRTEGVVDGLPMHGKLLRRRLLASTQGVLVLIIFIGKPRH